MKSTFVLTVAIVAGAVAADSNATTSVLRALKYPSIAGHGGIVSLPNAAEQPRKNTKVVLDVTSDKLAGSVVKGLDRAALICNLNAEAGLQPGSDFQLAVVLHGGATKAALSNEAYARHVLKDGDDSQPRDNPNLKLIHTLRRKGVEVFVCGQAVAYSGYQTDEVADDVTVAVSAVILNVNKQTDGYAYIPFH